MARTIGGEVRALPFGQMSPPLTTSAGSRSCEPGGSIAVGIGVLPSGPPTLTSRPNPSPIQYTKGITHLVSRCRLSVRGALGR